MTHPAGTSSPDTRQRFLIAIAERIPRERIAEVHLFHPIRQGGVESGVAVVVETSADEAASKIIVHTALYRLALKGPNRGAWETNIVAEADAPLITVDAVVRGVQRRAGDVDEPTRLEGDEVRALLPPLPPAPPAPVDDQGERTNSADEPLVR